MNAMDKTNPLYCSPYLRLTPRSEREAREDAAQLEAMGALKDLFDTASDVVFNIFRIGGENAVDVFADKGGARTALRQAYEHAEDSQAQSYPSHSYRGSIELHSDGTWSVVKLFKGDV